MVVFGQIDGDADREQRGGDHEHDQQDQHHVHERRDVDLAHEPAVAAPPTLRRVIRAGDGHAQAARVPSKAELRGPSSSRERPR